MGEVTYAPLGPWWTLDGPSLRLPGPGGRYFSVWMAGGGPCVAAALGPRASSVDSWLPLTSRLGHDVTLAATELPHGPRSISTAEVVAVVNGTGAQLLLTHGDAAESVLASLREGALRLPVVVHAWEPTGPTASSAHDVRFISGPPRTIAQDVEDVAALVLDVARELLADDESSKEGRGTHV